ncbi:MAG TPA: dienelactone hydrolase family protein [Polyangiaceae bacterium]
MPLTNILRGRQLPMRRVLAVVATLITANLLACRTRSETQTGGGSNAAPTNSIASAASPTDGPASAGAPVDLPDGGRGYLVLPEGQGKHPAIIVIQEWWGLNDWIRENTARFARQGYVALAVDLYRGRATSDPGEAHELMRGMPEDRALGDLQAGFQWLAARADVDPNRIGSIGWCMGGGYSLAFATSEPRLRAVVVNYGRLITTPAKIDAIRATVLGNFAGADRGIPPADVRSFESQLKERKKDHDIKIYDGKAHAFMNPGNKDGYDAPAASDAWSRIDAFFARTLKAL